MPRLEGEKQSVLPYILGIGLIAAVGAGVYFYAQSNQQNSAVNNTSETFSRPIPAFNSNSVTRNSTSGNSASGNEMSGNSTTENSTTENTATNSVSRTTPTTNVTGGSSP